MPMHSVKQTAICFTAAIRIGIGDQLRELADPLNA